MGQDRFYHSLGILQRVGGEKFTLGEGNAYIPEISRVARSIYRRLKSEFPYINLCVWNTSALNEFMLHQPNRFYYLVETDKETTDAVFYFLGEIRKAVFLDPTNDISKKYLFNGREVFIVDLLPRKQQKPQLSDDDQGEKGFLFKDSEELSIIHRR